MGSFNSLLEIFPILTASAVWELEGPTMTGPIISDKSIIPPVII